MRQFRESVRRSAKSVSEKFSKLTRDLRSFYRNVPGYNFSNIGYPIFLSVWTFDKKNDKLGIFGLI